MIIKVNVDWLKVELIRMTFGSGPLGVRPLEGRKLLVGGTTGCHNSEIFEQLIVDHLQTTDCAVVTTIAMQFVQWVRNNELCCRCHHGSDVREHQKGMYHWLG